MSKYRFDQIAINSTAKKKPTEEDKYHYIGLEHIDSQNLIVSRWGSEVAPKGDKLLMKKGDVLFGKRRAYQKKVAIAPFDGIFSAHGMVLRPNEEVVDKDFFPMFISSDYFLDAAIAISVGSLSPTINWKDLARLEFDLPSMEEQRKLAEVLWSINDTLQAYQKLLTETDALVQAQFVEMFGDPRSNPDKWPTAKLASLGELARGVSKARPRNQPELLGGEYPLIQTGEITNSGAYITHHESTYSELGLAQSRMWPKGTLCITIAANIAQTGILTYDACFPDSVVGFISAGRVEQVFMHYWFSFFQDLLEAQATQVAQKNINLKTLGQLDVYLPPIDKQKEFVVFFHQSDNSKSALQNTIASLQTTKRSIVETALGTGRKE